MIFKPVNIIQELTSERNKASGLLENATALLQSSSRKDELVIKRLHGNGNVELCDGPSSENDIQLEKRDLQNIFDIQQIKTICINYRLRFLDTKYFKHEFPYEAIIKINEFEKHYNTKIKKFRIIAPDKAFELQEENQDPLLFAQLSDNRYYLIHQWGSDLAWYRKFIYYPIRDIYTYFYSTLIAAIIFAYSIPFSWYQVERDNEFYMRTWFSVHCFIGLFFFNIFLGAVAQTGFSTMNWKSKYMNE
jgi:hypothetical protein